MQRRRFLQLFATGLALSGLKLGLPERASGVYVGRCEIRKLWTIEYSAPLPEGSHA